MNFSILGFYLLNRKKQKNNNNLYSLYGHPWIKRIDSLFIKRVNSGLPELIRTRLCKTLIYLLILCWFHIKFVSRVETFNPSTLCTMSSINWIGLYWRKWGSSIVLLQEQDLYNASPTNKHDNIIGSAIPIISFLSFFFFFKLLA